MKAIIRQKWSMKAASLLSFLILAVPSFAMVNQGAPPKTNNKGDCPPFGGQGSLHWTYQIGKTRITKLGLLAQARNAVTEGYQLGEMPRDFDEIFSVFYQNDPVKALEGVFITLEADRINPDLFEKEAISVSGGLDVISHVNNTIPPTTETLQIRTLTGSTAIANPYPFQPDGWTMHVLGWNSSPGPVSSYVKTLKVAVPNGHTKNSGIEFIDVDYRGNAGSKVTITQFIASMENGMDVQTMNTYSANEQLADRKLVESEKITYIDRGSKTNDYTLLRETYSVKVTASGPDYGNLVLDSRRVEEYRDFTPGEAQGEKKYKRLIREVEGYGTSTARETKYSWYDEPSNLMIHGRLQAKLEPDGKWEYHQYQDSEGAALYRSVKYSAWRDALFGEAMDGSEADLANAKKEILEIASDNEFAREISYAGVIVSRETLNVEPQSDGSSLVTQNKYSGSNELLSKVTWKLASESAPQHLAGRILWRENSDGTAETFEYSPITRYGWLAGIKVVHRKGAGDRDGVVSGSEITSDLNEYYEVASHLEKDIASGLTLNFWIATEVDNVGRPTRIEYNANSNDYETFQYACCGLERHRKRDASVTFWNKDPLLRVYRETSYRYEGDPNPLITATTYDGLTTTETKGGLLVRSVTSDLNGEIREIKSPDQNGDLVPESATIATSFPTSGGKIVTLTNPDGGTVIEDTYPDGNLRLTTGTAVPDIAYAYGTHTLNGNGLWTQTIKLTASGGFDEWEKEYRDGLKRLIRIEYPSDLNGDSELDHQELAYYPSIADAGSRGQLQYTKDPDGVRASFTYNNEGRITSIAQQMPSNQTKQTTFTYNSVNDTDIGVSFSRVTSINGVTTESHFESGDGYREKTVNLGRKTIISKAISNWNGNSTITTSLPDETSVEHTITGNLMTKIARRDTSANEISWTARTYDPLRRLASETDSRIGAKTINSYTEAGQVLSITAPGSRTTTYSYDVMGRRISVNQPDTLDLNGNPIDNITYTSYHLTGKIAASWGDQTYPTYRCYDEQGRLIELRTYRNLAHGVRPIAATLNADITLWNYHSQRGWLASKRDAAALGVDYSYTAGGRLSSRQWARTLSGGARLTTLYGYDVGLLTSTTYNDGITLDLTYSYDAFGRQTLVTQGSGNSWSYAYHPSSLQLIQETISYDTNDDGLADFTRVLERSQDALLRPVGYQLKNGVTVETGANYAYDIVGRLQSVTSGADVFNYSYQANSLGLIQSVTAPSHTVTNSWDITRDALIDKENKVNATLISSYDYVINDLSQRTSVVRTSDIPALSAYSYRWKYNVKGELVSARHTGWERSRFYEYDGIGNRIKSRAGSHIDSGGLLTEYTANVLNQYDAINTSEDNPNVSPTYDADGNQELDSLPIDPSKHSNYVWDGENRLIEIRHAGAALGSYRYDPFGRRIAKTDYGGTRWFVYDGWNLLSESDVGGGLLRSHVWGADLSGSFQGVGGVGGLVSTTIQEMGISGTFYPVYDGNGNITEYLDENGEMIAHFHYDAFGLVTDADGEEIRFFFRYGTTYEDFESGLNYYGYRYYHSLQGRWINRDPIAEKGGLNLLAFVQNSPTSWFDVLGLSKPKCTSPDKQKEFDKMWDEAVKNGGEMTKQNIKDIESSPHNNTINISDSVNSAVRGAPGSNPSNASNGTGQGTHMNFNPNEGKSTGHSSQAVFEHEIQHMADRNRGTLPEKTSEREKLAIDAENQGRVNRGEDERPYSDHPRISPEEAEKWQNEKNNNGGCGGCK